MSPHCSITCRRMKRGKIFDLMRVFDGCGGYEGGSLVG